jgi:hypothetical protein
MKQPENPANKSEAPTAVRSGDWLGDFVNQLHERKAKLRKGAKTVCNMETMVLRHLPTIEIQVSARKWLPLKMPTDKWYFETNEQRDEMLELLTGKLLAKAMSPNEKS